jgi:hypothetical protein
MYIGRETTQPTTTNNIRSMNTIQVVINGNQVEGQIAQIAEILSMVSSNMVQPIASVTNNEPAELAPFNAFLTVELTPYFGAKDSLKIVDKLKRSCALRDYRYLIPVYRIAGGDLKKRQLLKLVSAVHRYKFGGYKNPEKYSLRSEIKYAKACDECGKLAGILYTRLQKEGLI